MKNDLSNDSKKISSLIVKLIQEKKGYDINVIYVDKLTTITDIFIICTSDSEPQTRAITNNIKDSLKECGIKANHIEGYEYLKWVLMDFFNVTVNIFSKEYREFYTIERLWADAKVDYIKN